MADSRFFRVKIQAVPNGCLVMHNGQLADPLNAYAKELKKYSAKRKKSDDDHMKMAEVEFQGGLYFDEEDGLGPFIPGDVLDATLKNGAKRKRLGTAFDYSVRVVEEKNRLDYKGPRTRDALWADEHFRDRRGVKVSKARVMRTRPSFRNWSLTFVVELFPFSVNPEDLKQAVIDAGDTVGLLEMRPRYGAFKLVAFDEIANPHEQPLAAE